MTPTALEPRGKLVALEGIDGAGKGTQAAALALRARSAGLAVETIAFPRYTGGLYGDLCARYLAGEFGSVGGQSPYLIALLYAGDRLEFTPALRDALARNDLVIADRYVASNIAHQGAKLPLSELAGFAEWVGELEYRVHRIPREDLVLLLDMPVKVALSLMDARTERPHLPARDIHETDAEYLTEVALRYQWLAANMPNWVSVSCSDDGRHARSPQAVTSDLARVVGSLVGREL